MTDRILAYKKAAEYIAKNYLSYDEAELIGFGTRGFAFAVDNGKKILKLTEDIDEALRAERIRGKNFKNLIGYYSVKKIKSSNKRLNGIYYMLMDKLPKVLTDDEVASEIFLEYSDRFDIEVNDGDMPGYDIKDPNKLKKYIKQKLSGYMFYNELTDEYKIIAERMWFDLIQIRKQLRKCGIITNDLTEGNLGFDKNGNLIFFDMGYPGEGNKELRNKEVQVQIDESNDVFDFNDETLLELDYNDGIEISPANEEALPQQHTVDQLKRIKKKMDKEIGGDIGDKISDMNKQGANIQYIRNPIETGIESYQDFERTNRKIFKFKDFNKKGKKYKL